MPGSGPGSLRLDAERRLPSVTELTPEICSRFFANNVTGAYLMLRAVLPQIRGKGWGRDQTACRRPPSAPPSLLRRGHVVDEEGLVRADVLEAVVPAGREIDNFSYSDDCLLGHKDHFKTNPM